jgi:hypothetical protein
MKTCLKLAMIAITVAVQPVFAKGVHVPDAGATLPLASFAIGGLMIARNLLRR